MPALVYGIVLVLFALQTPFTVGLALGIVGLGAVVVLNDLGG